MIRVLHSVSNMDRGGIETMLMNYYRHIDRSKVQFDFIVNKKKPGDYDDEIRRLGGHIYQSPGLDPLHYPAYLRFVQQTVAADPRIRILHAHNEAMGLYALKGAEKAGLPVRIAHAHNIWDRPGLQVAAEDALQAAAARRGHPPVGLRPGRRHLLFWQGGLGAPGTDHSQRH